MEAGQYFDARTVFLKIDCGVILVDDLGRNGLIIDSSHL